ncbi:MAG TPA: hypothetical protein VGO78_26585, partial [Acidimicrobiales bacterium]|nr:hypothetical protein [Acidimicrobiales bacterium]
LGTEGRVLLVDGFTWTRYRVTFDNGYDLGSIDGSHLSRPREFDAALAQREAASHAVAEVAADDDGGGAAAATGEGKVVNGVSVPAHLLDRSKRARERLTAA